MESNSSLLCGSLPFWDLELSWNTDIPTLTRCFRRVVVSVIPNAIFWLILPLYVYKLRQRDVATSSKLSLLSCIKVFLAGFLSFVSLMDLIYWAIDENLIGADILESSLRFLTFVSIAILVLFEFKRGARISSVQFLFFATLLPCHIVNVYCEIIDYLYYQYQDLFAVVTSIVSFSLTLATFISHFFADKRPDYQKPSGEKAENENPILDASFPSLLTFSWFSNFAWLGFKRSLGFDDLYDLPPFVQSASVVPSFLDKWDSKPSPKKAKAVKADFENGAIPEVKILDPNPDSSLKGDVVRTIVKTFGSSFLISSILKFLHDIFVFVSPLLLKRIIQYAASEEQVWKGILYALGLLLTTSLQSVMLAKYFYEMYLIGIWVRSSITASLYRKSLRISPQGKGTFINHVNIKFFWSILVHILSYFLCNFGLILV